MNDDAQVFFKILWTCLQSVVAVNGFFVDVVYLCMMEGSLQKTNKNSHFEGDPDWKDKV